MNRTLLIALFLTQLAGLPAFAQDKPSHEPAALVRARKAYEADVNAAVDPITEKYVKQLNELKKDFMAKGDLESAQAVQREIHGLTVGVTLIGKWTWPPAASAEFLEDGTSEAHSVKGKWKLVDKKTRKYKIVWSNGYIDWVTLSADGTTLSGRNNHGDTFRSERLPPDSQE
jgi:hypothetical protein